jgi:hypothetical protein
VKCQTIKTRRTRADEAVNPVVSRAGAVNGAIANLPATKAAERRKVLKAEAVRARSGNINAIDIRGLFWLVRVFFVSAD